MSPNKLSREEKTNRGYLKQLYKSSSNHRAKIGTEVNKSKNLKMRTLRIGFLHTVPSEVKKEKVK